MRTEGRVLCRNFRSVVVVLARVCKNMKMRALNCMDLYAPRMAHRSTCTMIDNRRNSNAGFLFRCYRNRQPVQCIHARTITTHETTEEKKAYFLLDAPSALLIIAATPASIRYSIRILFLFFHT